MNTLPLPPSENMHIQDICNMSDASLEQFCRQASVLEDAVRNHGAKLLKKYEEQHGEVSMVREYVFVHESMASVLESLSSYIQRALDTPNGKTHLKEYLQSMTKSWEISTEGYMRFIITQVLGADEVENVFPMLNVFIKTPMNIVLEELRIPYEDFWRE